MKYFKASFKGVSFEVTSSEGMFGRRVQEHEFPFADANVFEDLGKASQAFIVDGFVIGDDFQARAENLIKVLESKGPGKLVHPWFGTLEVYAVAPMRVKWSLEDRIAQISMSFKKVEAEQKPSLSIASDYLSRLYADSFLETAVNAFKTGYECYQNITNLAIDIDKALSQGISQVTDFLSTIASSEFAVFNGIQASIKSLISEAFVAGYNEKENKEDEEEQIFENHETSEEVESFEQEDKFETSTKIAVQILFLKKTPFYLKITNGFKVSSLA